MVSVLLVSNTVDSALRRCTLPSPPGTFLLSLPGIFRVQDKSIQRAMVLRILRYISFHPWGSLRADANRRTTSISQITHKLWKPNPFVDKIRMFVAGGGVLWIPVAIEGNYIKTPDSIFLTGIRDDDSFGWLACRQPPLHRQKMEARGLISPLRVNITQQIKKALERRRDGAFPSVQYLYDCRFLISLDAEKIPAQLADELLSPQNQESIMIYPHTRWYWPKVVRERDGMVDVLHSKIDSSPGSRRDDYQQKSYDYWKPRVEAVASDWITIRWIRSLEAI